MEIGTLSLSNPAAGLALESSSRPAGANKIEDAARQFESLLMAQLLRISHGEDSGWLGTGEDTTMSSAMDLAQEYLAQGMTTQGGLGLTQYVKEHLATAK